MERMLLKIAHSSAAVSYRREVFRVLIAKQSFFVFVASAMTLLPHKHRQYKTEIVYRNLLHFLISRVTPAHIIPIIRPYS